MSELKDTGLYDFFLARRREYTTQGISRYSTMFVYADLPTGSEAAYQLLNVTLTLKNWGKFSHDATAKLEVDFKAQDVQTA